MATGGQQTGCIETDAEMAPEISYNRPNGDVCTSEVSYGTREHFPNNPSQGYKTDACAHVGDRSCQAVGHDKPSQICTSSTTQKVPMYHGQSQKPQTCQSLQPDPITDDDIPPELKEGNQYDILMLYADKDRDNAFKLKDILERFVCVNGERLRICTEYDLPWINSKFAQMDEAIARSTYMFLFITKTFCNDEWATMQKDDVLMTSIEDDTKRWCVVPLFVDGRRKPGYTLPFGIKGLKGIDVSLLLGKRHLTDVNVNKLTESDLDKFVITNITKLISCRVSLKENRKREDARKLRKWKEEEYARRREEMLEDEMRRQERDALLRRPTTQPGSPRMDEKFHLPDDPPRSPRSPRLKEDQNRSSIILNINNVQNLQIGNNNQIQRLLQDDVDEPDDEDLPNHQHEQLSSHRPTTPVDVTANSPRDPTLTSTSQVTADGGSGDTTPENTPLKEHYPVGSSRDHTRSSGDCTGSSQRSLPAGEIAVTANHFGIAVRHSPGDDDDDDVELMKPMGYGQTLCPGGDASLDDDTNLMKPATLQLTGPKKDWSARNYRNDGTRV